MPKLTFALAALALLMATSAQDNTAVAADLGSATGAATQPLGAPLNPGGIGTTGDAASGNLHFGGKGKPRDGIIEPSRDFSFSSQSGGGGSYAVTVNKKLLSF